MLLILVAFALYKTAFYLKETYFVRPEVIASYPMAGDTEFPLDGVISITFSRKMDHRSVEDAIVFSPPLEVTKRWESNTLILKPTTPFERDSQVQFTIKNTARGQNWLSLKTASPISFTTLSNPAVSIASPTGSMTTEVGNIVIMFNKSIKRPDGEFMQITPSVAGEGKWIGSAAYMFTPAGLTKGETYKVSITNDLVSEDGGVLKKGYEFSFINYAPAILEVRANENSYNNINKDVSPNGPFYIYFNQQIDRAYLANKVKLINQTDGTSIPLNISYRARTPQDDSDWYYHDWEKFWQEKVIITPTRTLAPLGSYSLNIESGIKSKVGAAFTEFGQNYMFSVADTPGFIMSNIVDGAVDISEHENLVLTFKSPMSRDSFTQSLQVRKNGTLVKEDYFVSVYSQGKEVSINRFLDRSTNYEFVVPATTKDAFGRNLGQEVRIRLTTAPYKPSVSIYPNYKEIVTFADNLSTRFITKVVNTPELEYSIYSMDVPTFIDYFRKSNEPYFATGGLTDEKITGMGMSKVKSWTNKLDLEPNILTDVLFDVNRDMNLDLKSGIYLLNIRQPNPTAFTSEYIAFVVGDVSLTQKVSNKKLLVWATSLSKSENKSDYNVKVYGINPIKPQDLKEQLKQMIPALGSKKSDSASTENTNEQDGSFVPVFEGKTGTDGVLFTDNPINPDQAEMYLTVVEKDGDIGIVFESWDDGISSYNFDEVNFDYEVLRDGPAKYKAYAFTDRRLYRPGQTLHYNAFLRQNDLGGFSKVKDNGVVTVKIQGQNDYYGETAVELYSQTYDMSKQDMFFGDFTLPLGLELGRYTVDLSLNGQSLFQTAFDVQEYVRPEFEVVTSVPNKAVIRGQSVELSSVAKYFYGAPLVGQQDDYRLYKRKYIFTLPDYYDYNFYSTRRYFNNEEYWSGLEEEKVSEGSTVTNNEGKMTYSPPTTTPSGVSEIYTFESEVLGLNGRKFTGSGEYIVHMADYYTGISADTYLGEVGSKSKFNVLTISPEGTKVSDAKVNANIYLRQYFRTKKKDNSEGYMYEVTFKDTLVENLEVTTNSKGEAVFEFEPKNAGTHIIEVQSIDDKGNRTISDIFHYVSSTEESGYWRKENNDRIDLITNRLEYAPGDTAEIIPLTTIEKAQVLLTAEAEDILAYTVYEQTTNSQIAKINISEKYKPNVYVSMLLVAPGKSVYSPAEFKMGITNLKVDSSKNNLKVEMTTNKNSYAPKEEGEAVLRVVDNNGRAVEGATISVALVDDALMSIASLKRDNTFNYFYSARPLAVTTAQSLTVSLDRININTEIGAKGGSGSKGGAGGEYPDLTRSNFAETALWLPQIKTNSDGIAKVKFNLPDSTTRWNLFALIQDSSGAKFGQGTYKFGASLELFGMPALPRFMRVGDSAQLGVVVQNNSSKARDVTVQTEATGVEFAGVTTKTINMAPNSAKKVYFDAVAKEEVPVQITFKILENANPKDIVIGTFPVLPFGLEVIQSVSNSVKYEAKESFEVPVDANKEHGGLDVKVYGSLVGLAEKPLKSPMDAEYYSVEILNSRLVPLVYQYKLALFQKDEVKAGKVKSQIETDLSLLLSAQLGDGGWGYWTKATQGTAASTAKALEVLAEVSKAGLQVNTDAVDKGLKFLQEKLSNDKLNTVANPYYLYVLELHNVDQSGRIATAYSKKATFSDGDKAYLIMAMSADGKGWSKQINQLKSELLAKADLGSGRVFWSNLKSYFSCYSCDDFSATAVVLRAFNKSDPDGLVANLAIKYLTQLKEPDWGYISTTEGLKTTALLENILNRNIQARDSSVTLLLNGKEVAAGEVKGRDSNSIFTHLVSVKDMLAGINTVDLKMSKGGNAYYSMVLTTLMPFDKVLEASNGFGLVREIFDTSGKKVQDNKFKLGETYVVKLIVAAPNSRRNVILEDFLPAGFESVNETLTNESMLTVAEARYGDAAGNDLYYVDSQQMKDSSTQIQMAYLPQGIYEYTYVMRAIVPGEYKYRPAHIFETNSPDIRANSNGLYITVE